MEISHGEVFCVTLIELDAAGNQTFLTVKTKTALKQVLWGWKYLSPLFVTCAFLPGILLTLLSLEH